MTWKTPLVKASADLLSHRSGIVSHLLRNEHVASEVADDSALIRAMFGKGGPWRKVLDNPALRAQLGLDKDAAAWVDPLEVMVRLSKDELLDIFAALEHRKLISPADLLAHFGTEQFLEKIGADQVLASLKPDQLFERLGRDRILDRLCREDLIRHLGPVAMLDALTPDQMITYLGPEKMVEHLGSEMMLAHLDTGDMLEYLDTGDMLEFLETDDMLRHAGPDRAFNYLGVDRMLKHLGPDRIFEYLGADEALRRAGPEKMLEHLGPDAMLDYLGPDRMLAHLGAERMLKHIGPEKMLDFLGPERMLRRLGPEKMMNYLGADTMIAHVGVDKTLALIGSKKLLEHLGWDRMFQHLGLNKMMQRLGPAEMLKHIGPAKMLEELGPKMMLDYLGLERMLEHLGPRKMMESVGVEKAMEFFGEEKMLERLGHRRMLDYLSSETVARRVDWAALFEDFDADGKRAAARIAANPAVIDALAANDEAMKQILLSEEARKKLRVLDGLSWTGALSYALPAAVVSYPRSGSNFLQSILTHSTGTNNVSIYMQNPMTQVPLLTVKSHAPSPGYLMDEYQRLLSIERGPGRIVLIKRDPRDVMISFYEYAQAQRETKIGQEEFLEDICFFYASTIDKTYSRRVDKAPMSVVEAYKKHVRTWFAERPHSLPAMEISYEDLVKEPLDAFRTVFDFLAIDAPVAEGFLDVRVSQYSEERRERGGVHSWRNHRNEYRVLLGGVERLLGDEIQILGYASVPSVKPNDNSRKRAPQPNRESKPKNTAKKKRAPRSKKKTAAPKPKKL